MLKAYLASIVIWMIIIYSTAILLERSIENNGWLDEKDKEGNVPKTLFVISAIPFVRLTAVLCCIFMASCTKEQYTEIVEKIKNDMEE